MGLLAGFAHEADAPYSSSQGSQPSADFNAIVFQQPCPDHRIVHPVR